MAASNITAKKDDEQPDDEDNMEWLYKTKEIAELCNQHRWDCETCADCGYDHPYYHAFHTKTVYYGDDGSMRLQYPVWILDGKYDSSDSTSSCSTTTEALLDDFYELNNERRDFHAHPSPVEDIIDPDLLIYRPQIADAEREEEMSLRDQYQWIPSDFRVNRNEVHIETPICHLPMNEKYENT
ncbi:unnamed protein product, partial [Didymodactylos carnosus]